MKNVIIFFGSIVFLISCSQNNDLNFKKHNSNEDIELRSISSEVFERAGIQYIKGGISIHCTTNACDGNNTGHTDHCQVVTDLNGRFECTCSGCKMTVTFDTYKSEIDVWEQIYRENLHFDDFEAFTRRKHGIGIKSFNRVDFNFQPEVTTIMYTYELKDGTVETVMYSNTYTNKGIIDKTYEIDCSGSCGCREIFDFNTNRAECSCDDCILSVTVKE